MWPTLLKLQLTRETTCLTRSYRLPDGQSIKVGSERFLAPEALFDPSLADVEGPGIARMTFESIQVGFLLSSLNTAPLGDMCMNLLVFAQQHKLTRLGESRSTHTHLFTLMV